MDYGDENGRFISERSNIRISSAKLSEVRQSQNRVRTEVGQSQDRDRTELGQGQDRVRTEVGQRQDRVRIEIGQSQDRVRTELGQRQDRGRTELDQSQDRVMTALLMNKVSLHIKADWHVIVALVMDLFVLYENRLQNLRNRIVREQEIQCNSY